MLPLIVFARGALAGPLLIRARLVLAQVKLGALPEHAQPSIIRSCPVLDAHHGALAIPAHNTRAPRLTLPQTVGAAR